VQGTQIAGLGETGDELTDTPLGESRWPPVLAILVFLLMNIAVRMVAERRGTPRPLAAADGECILLLVLLTSDPSSLGARRTLHRVALTLAGILVAAALWATVLLVADPMRYRSD